MADIIQLRRDTAANWTSANPILAQGEAGVELTTNNLKIGDGVTAWSALSYALRGPAGWDAIFIDEKTAGTAGGTFTSGAWRTRDLNTSVANSITGASLATNQITLPAGTYYLEAAATAYGSGGHRVRIYNATAAVPISLTANSVGINAAGVNQLAHVFGEFTLVSTSAIELQHRCTITGATEGYGVAANIGEPEVYSYVRIREA